MHVQGKPVLAFDPEGLVFSVGVQSEMVKLYDLRSYDKGPFATFKVPRETKCEWTGLRFSPHGKKEWKRGQIFSNFFLIFKSLLLLNHDIL